LFFKNKKTEHEFRLSLIERDRKSTQFIFVIFIILYAFFGLLDLQLAPAFVKLFYQIRFFVVIPILLMTIVFSFTKVFPKIYQYLLFLSLVAGGMGIVIMLVTYPENITYYGGLFLVLYSGFFLVRLRFIYAVMAGWIIFTTFVLGMFYYSSLDHMAILVGMSLFYFSSIVIGTFGSYSIEKFSRQTYIQKKRIEHDKSVLEDRVLSQTNEIVTAQIVTIFSLAKLVESRDKETGLHVERVGKYCYLIAEALPEETVNETKMSIEEFCNVIEFASALHDIGKVGIADTILNKEEALSEVEFEKIKQHTIIGSETLINVQNRYPNNKFINMGIEITRWHHERFDGTGYPDELMGNNIPLSARIMAVADVYDALRSNRPYKRAYSHQKALNIITQEAGTHFDPLVVKALLKQEKKIEAFSKNTILD
jgi:HD-GYP domain-containing protein (c-di-GMP phosphodiesterase class II)